MTGLPPEQALLLTIRFTIAVPDLELPIKSPSTTTTLSLKRLIRARLPASVAGNRLRLIYAGKVLNEPAPLNTSLNIPPPPKGRPSSYGKSIKGKEPVRDDIDTSQPRRIFLHCSIGDPLTPDDLSAESFAALESEAALISKSSEDPLKGLKSSTANSSENQPSVRRDSIPSAPQGFDRLQSSGFTPSEVAALRSQFMAVLAHTHTPDTMPTGLELRRLEDRWLDSSATEPGNGAGTATTIDGEPTAETGWGGGFNSEDGRGLDDLLWGNVLGFFWPLGALVWGFREEGVWTQRRRIAVGVGVLVNLGFGFVRLGS